MNNEVANEVVGAFWCVAPGLLTPSAWLAMHIRELLQRSTEWHGVPDFVCNKAGPSIRLLVRSLDSSLAGWLSGTARGSNVANFPITRRYVRTQAVRHARNRHVRLISTNWRHIAVLNYSGLHMH